MKKDQNLPSKNIQSKINAGKALPDTYKKIDNNLFI